MDKLNKTSHFKQYMWSDYQHLELKTGCLVNLAMEARVTCHYSQDTSESSKPATSEIQPATEPRNFIKRSG